MPTSIKYISPSLLELSHLVAKRFVTLAKQAIETHGNFHAAFSGGKTPQILFELLASPIYIAQIPWENIHLYICDERFVPHSHPDSNFGALKKLVIDHIPIPFKQIHAIQTENITPEEAASAYHQDLTLHLPKDNDGNLQLDFILLGVGEDGHIASLFPDTTILSIMDKSAAAVFVEKLQSYRISLTFPILNHAKHVAFIVTGQNKAPILNQIFSNFSTQPLYPIQMLKIEGEIEWYLDSTIAGLLTSSTT